MSAVLEPTTVPVAIDTSTLAVYLRVSTEEQRERQTVESQRAAADRYLAAHDITPYGWYVDDGVSGTLPLSRRPQGARLLADVRAGHVKTVLFHKLDRLGRSVRVLIDARDELLDAGVELVSINEHLDTSNAAGRMFFNQLSSFAEFERDTILERSTAGTQRRLRAGGWMGGEVPYGFAVEGKQETARLVVDAPTAAVVRRIYTWQVEQGWTCRKIADALNAEGIPAPRGGQWGHGRVYDILTNPLYRGEAIYGKRRKGHARGMASLQGTMTVTVEAIVSPETWQAAQTRLGGHKHWQQRAEGRTYLLAGLMRCGVCGHVYSGEWSPATGSTTQPNHPGYRTYRCAAARRPQTPNQPRCHSVGVNAEWVEQQVLSNVLAWIADPGAALTLAAAHLTGQADQAEALRADLAKVQRDLDAQQAERDTVLTLFRKGLCNERDLSRQLDAITQEQTALLGKQRKLEGAAAQAGEAAGRLASAAAALAQLHERQAAGALDLREAVEGLVLSIVVETVDAGRSTRGRPKSAPHVRVVYRFEAPSRSAGNLSRMDGRASQDTTSADAALTLEMTYVTG